MDIDIDKDIDQIYSTFRYTHIFICIDIFIYVSRFM
jgi:hypothetical protein